MRTVTNYFFLLAFGMVLLHICLAESSGKDDPKHRASGSLEKDDPKHRAWSDKLDEKFTGNSAYDKVARPLIHGTYHAKRYVESGNSAEWARAKDQYSKVGTGQQRTDYLKEHRALQKAKQGKQVAGRPKIEVTFPKSKPGRKP